MGHSLAKLQLSENECERFGHLLHALRCGAPPHGGLALGLCSPSVFPLNGSNRPVTGFDRLVALLCHATSIRDVIAFPKVKDASCLMTEAPGVVDDQQLEELCIRIADSKEEQK